MVRVIAVIFALLNTFPLFWMVWSSLMGNTDILQGNFIPEPYRRDVYFFQPVEGVGSVAATLNGQLYIYPEGSLDKKERESWNFHTVSSSYALKDKDLYVFSADEALMLFDLETKTEVRKWDWSFFEQSFKEADFTFFYPIPDAVPEVQWQRLSKLLNETPLVSGGDSVYTLSSYLSEPFPTNDSILISLNYVLNQPPILREILSRWEKEKDWLNPVILELFKKTHRTPKEERELFRWCLAEKIPHAITSFRQIAWENIWVNRLPQSEHGLSVKWAGHYLCMGIWWEAFPGVAVLDSRNPNKLRWITIHQGLPTSAIQNIIPVSDTEVLLIHDYGFSLLDVETETVLRNYSFGESGLPPFFGRDLRSAKVGNSAILFTYGNEIFFFDFRAGKVLHHLFSDEGGFYSNLSAIHVVGNQVYFGFSGGVMEISLLDFLYSDIENSRIYSGYVRNFADTSVRENGVVTSIYVQENQIWIGTISGRLALIDKVTGESTPGFLPKGNFFLHWRNYQDLLRIIPFQTFIFNSFVVCFSSMLIVMFFATFSAYVLTRVRRNLNNVILITQVVPVILYLIPLFLIFAAVQQHFDIHLLNSKAGMIFVYTILFLPPAIWILRGFYLMLPRELEEAALMDGCSRIGAFFRVTLPAVFPGIAATGIYVFLLAWDELMISWALSSDINSATIPVGIRLYAGQFGSRFDLLMAAATLSTIPVFLLFFLMRRQIYYRISGAPASEKQRVFVGKHSKE